MYKVIFINKGESDCYFAIVQEYVFQKHTAFRIIQCFENLNEVMDFLDKMNILYKNTIENR